jgi:serine protease Do
MFENNSYEIKNENTAASAKKKGVKPSVIIAMLLSMVIIGGGAGYGGAYLAGQNLPAAAVSVNDSLRSSENDNAVQTTSKPNADTPIFTQLDNNNAAVYAGEDASAMFEAVTPSVTFITVDFGDAGSGTGTGIIMSEDGYIITNAHVVEAETPVYSGGGSGYPFGFPFGGFGGGYTTELRQADKIIVTLSDEDKTEYEAEIIGLDTTTDLAVIKIDAKGLRAANIGNSEELKLGQNCFTLGYPLGIGLSASDGIISGLDREIGIEMNNGKSQNIPLIQITAAINPGNSGGPLLDSAGNVIGITSSKLASSSIEGVGFAIPISTAMPIVNELMDTGTYQSKVPKIGITGQDMTATYARYYGLPVDTGVLVTSVEDGSAAQAAGIREGDVIISADGKPVTTMEDLNDIKNSHKAGDTMTLGLARDGGDTEVTITLGSDS